MKTCSSMSLQTEKSDLFLKSYPHTLNMFKNKWVNAWSYPPYTLSLLYNKMIYYEPLNPKQL